MIEPRAAGGRERPCGRGARRRIGGWYPSRRGRMRRGGARRRPGRRARGGALARSVLHSEASRTTAAARRNESVVVRKRCFMVALWSGRSVPLVPECSCESIDPIGGLGKTAVVTGGERRSGEACGDRSVSGMSAPHETRPSSAHPVERSRGRHRTHPRGGPVRHRRRRPPRRLPGRRADRRGTATRRRRVGAVVREDPVHRCHRPRGGRRVGHPLAHRPRGPGRDRHRLPGLRDGARRPGGRDLCRPQDRVGRRAPHPGRVRPAPARSAPTPLPAHGRVADPAPVVARRHGITGLRCPRRAGTTNASFLTMTALSVRDRNSQQRTRCQPATESENRQ